MPTKKKTSKSTKNKAKTIEKQIDNLENNINNFERVQKEQKKKEKEEKKRKSAVEEKINLMREDLKAQLLNQNKFGEQFDDMIENYLFLVKLKEDLQHDISTNGFRYEAKTGNGYTTDKPNESVPNLLKVTTEMRKILQDLNLKEPDENPNPKEGEGDDLL